MKRSIFLVLLVAAGIMLPVALFAQTGAPDLPQYLAGPQPWMPQGSELGRNSFGVFTNPLDSAFNLFQVSAGSGFGSLGSSYAFGGADNLFGGAAVQGSTTGGGTPFYGGYYSQGKSPWSVYGYFNQTGVTGGDSAGGTAVNTVNSYTIGTATYQYAAQQTDTTYQTRPFASVNNDFVQTLFNVGPMTTGIGVKLGLVDNALPANNGTTVVTHNYNTTPTGAPTPTVDYTTTTVKTDARDATPAPSTYDIALGIPLLLKAGGLSHFATIGFEASGTDSSYSTVITNTNPKNPAGVAGAFLNSNTTVIDKSTLYQIPAGYALYLPPIIASNKKNQLIVTADTFVNLASAQYSSVITTANFNYPGGGAAWTPSTATDSEDTKTYAMAASFKVGAGAIHSLYFTPAPGIEYGIVPAVYLDYARLTNAPYLTTDLSVVKTDANNNGVFTDNGDSTQTTTTTYTNALSDVAGTVTPITTTDQFEAFISVPMVLKIMPQGWIFGFTLGTTPQAYYQFQKAAAASATKTQTQTTAVVGGATTTTTTDFVVLAPSSNISNNWTFQAIHTLALNFVFDKVTMDVSLNFKTVATGATPASNSISSLFDFNNLTIQAAVPLT